MAVYFLSDVHLRLDRPERGRRLARLVEPLGRADRIIVVGDLCDFWFASRQSREGVSECNGLRSLAAFRSRGGELTLLPGNHDNWLGPFYENALGVGFDPCETLDLDMGGLRIRALHGHLVGARSPWKGWMEGRAFLRIFSALPDAIAGLLSRVLDSVNEVKRDAINRKHLVVYRRHADAHRAEADLMVFGHIHMLHDDREGSPGLVVLGGWHERSSYLKVDCGEAILTVVEDDEWPVSGATSGGAGLDAHSHQA